MFKPGEKAILNEEHSPRGDVIILAGTPAKSKKHKWPVATDRGVFDETDLYPAHPSVLATIEGRDQSMEAFHERIEALDEEDEHLPKDKVERALYKAKEFEFWDKVQEALEKAPLDFNGHWKNGATLHDEFKVIKHLFLRRNSMSKTDAEDLLRAAAAGTPLDRWVPVDASMGLMGLRACSYCGEDDFGTETNGQTIRFAGKPCEFPNGLPLTEWELNVPSGKLVVANDLRELFPLPDGDDFDIGSTMGCRQTALAYATNGMSHAYVGNSCPGVFKCGEGLFKIANAPQDEEWDGKKHVKIKPAPKFEGERVAGICTDLWWYSLCDHEEFKRRCRRFKQKVSDFNIETVDVKPGVYRFHHDEEARSYEGPGECVYTRFEWIREPDPVKDFLTRYEEVDVNAHAYVQAQVARWPTLYGKVKERRGGKEEVLPWSRMSEAD
ncbi:MAG: hypothetical protein OK454_07110, partial [Thaumarchaeota archaeon]|nr:hypothetical protein [Nitrososphaerota archaeon]